MLDSRRVPRRARGCSRNVPETRPVTVPWPTRASFADRMIPGGPVRSEATGLGRAQAATATVHPRFSPHDPRAVRRTVGRQSPRPLNAYPGRPNRGAPDQEGITP